ncbi:MAG: DinB family protein [Candidatus Tectomicrobia bacterium]
MSIPITLHLNHDGDTGVEAWCSTYLGFVTWAEDRSQVLGRLADRIEWYRSWRLDHMLPLVYEPTGPFEVTEEIKESEGLFAYDKTPVTVNQIDLTIKLLTASRNDLIATLDSTPAAVLDWDPPYQRFATWADWRTIRANLAHIANAETQYYCRVLGHQPQASPVDAQDNWREFLPRTRRETLSFLSTLKASNDLLRSTCSDQGYGSECWTVGKALRRLVSHELTHWKSIVRITAVYRERSR